MRAAAPVLALLLLAAPAAAQRDPPVPAWPVGDLIVSRPQPIAIAGEEVTVRPELVEIRYRFVNRGPAEIEVPVVLPLPDIGPQILSTTAGGPRRDPENVIDLRVTADGQPVVIEVNLRAMVGTRDATAALQREQVPVSLFARSLVPSVTGRPIAVRRALASAGLVEFGELGGYEIKWTMRGWFTWRQRFALGRPVEITLRYRPLGGGFGADDSALDVPAAEQRCIDDAAREAFTRGHLPASLFPMGIRLGLSLGGATNWAGPPEVFGLAIDAGDPALVAVTCLEGMTRSAPGRLDGRFASFAPRGAIGVLFLPVRAPPRGDRPAEAGDPRFTEASQMRLSALRVAGYAPAELRAMIQALLARAGGPDRMTITERANLAVITTRLRDIGQSP
jgi:hypothetical protein